MKNKILLGICVILVGYLLFVVSQSGCGTITQSLASLLPSSSAKYITSVPVDLSQIESISKYRSCAGHDRSGYNFLGTLEADRSMKHYLYPIAAFQGATNEVKMFAPFNGTVQSIDRETNKVGGRPQTGNGITLTTAVDPNVGFSFGHIYFVQDFKVGDTVVAGQLIGYAALGDPGYDFDIDLTSLQKASDGQEILGSIFDHMTDSVLAEFAAYGVTKEAMSVSKEYRDANVCFYDDPTKNTSEKYGRSNYGWVVLVH